MIFLGSSNEIRWRLQWNFLEAPMEFLGSSYDILRSFQGIALGFYPTLTHDGMGLYPILTHDGH